MAILIDTHIHIYDSYKTEILFNAFRDNTIRAKANIGAMMLVEREGVDYFSKLKSGEGTPANSSIIESDSTSFIIRTPSLPDIIVIAGKQIVCKEKVEILAYGTHIEIPDGTPIRETINRVIEAGGKPVIAWGVGKWLFKREKLVKALLKEYSPKQLLIGDSALRPTIWTEPLIMRSARKNGFTVLAGSDTLPPSDQALRAGQYAERYDKNIDLSQPITPQLLQILCEKETMVFGRRSTLKEFLNNH
jgi:hypothetical protein